MEMPFHLKTLPPEALEILRYYGQNQLNVAIADAICDSTGLSDRGFGKAIRRLVTKSYLVMDGDQRYRLTDHGQRAVEDLAAAGELESSGRLSESDDIDDEEVAAPTGRTLEIDRRLTLVVPQPLVAGQAVNAYVAFRAPEGDNLLPQPITLILRLSVINGEPSSPVETPFLLDNDERRREFEITPGMFNKARVRVAAYQLDDDSGDTDLAGGLYVDVDVVPPGSAGQPAYKAYGANTRFAITV